MTEFSHPREESEWLDTVTADILIAGFTARNKKGVKHICYRKKNEVYPRFMKLTEWYEEIPVYKIGDEFVLTSPVGEKTTYVLSKMKRVEYPEMILPAKYTLSKKGEEKCTHVLKGRIPEDFIPLKAPYVHRRLREIGVDIPVPKEIYDACSIDLERFEVGSRWQYMHEPFDIITITSVELDCIKSNERTFDIPGFSRNFREHVVYPPEEDEEEDEEEEEEEEGGMVPLGSLLWNKETEKLYVVYASSDRFILISECQKKAVEFVPHNSCIVGPYETKNFMVVLPNIGSTFKMHGYESDCCLYNIRMNPCRIAYTTGNQICEIPIDDFLKKYIPK